MKAAWFRMSGVSVFVGACAVLFGVGGCSSAPEPAAQAGTQAVAPRALAGPAIVQEDLQAQAMRVAVRPASAMAEKGEDAPTDVTASGGSPAARLPRSVGLHADVATRTQQVATFYTVRKGDTLSRISKRYYGTPAKWRLILDANRGLLKDPRKLRPNMRLVIPSARPASAE